MTTEMVANVFFLLKRLFWRQIGRETAFFEHDLFIFLNTNQPRSGIFFEHGLIFFWTQIGREAAFFFERGLIFFWTNLAAKRPEFFFEFFLNVFFRREATSFFWTWTKSFKKTLTNTLEKTKSSQTKRCVWWRGCIHENYRHSKPICNYLNRGGIWELD